MNPYEAGTREHEVWAEGYREAVVDAMVMVNGMTDAKPEAEEEPEAEKPKITRPVSFEGYEVTAVRRKAIGEFYADKKFNCIDWRTEYGEEVSMTPDGWKEFAHEIPHILRILGVDA